MILEEEQFKTPTIFCRKIAGIGMKEFMGVLIFIMNSRHPQFEAINGGLNQLIDNPWTTADHIKFLG